MGSKINIGGSRNFKTGGCDPVEVEFLVGGHARKPGAPVLDPPLIENFWSFHCYTIWQYLWSHRLTDWVSRPHGKKGLRPIGVVWKTSSWPLTCGRFPQDWTCSPWFAADCWLSVAKWQFQTQAFLYLMNSLQGTCIEQWQSDIFIFIHKTVKPWNKLRKIRI